MNGLEKGKKKKDLLKQPMTLNIQPAKWQNGLDHSTVKSYNGLAKLQT